MEFSLKMSIQYGLGGHFFKCCDVTKFRRETVLTWPSFEFIDGLLSRTVPVL